MRISVVTPSLNQAQFLEQTLRSILDQDYQNLELVVIDGGSTDGSIEIIKRYESRLAYWISERDGGHSSALNKGFNRTSGEIMAWLNSDDIYFPWTLRSVAEIFSTYPDVKWITGASTLCDSQGRIVHAYVNLKNKYDFLLGRYAWISQESTFWRRSLWDSVGGQINEDYRFMVDGELWTRFFLKERLHHVRCVLGGFRSWSGNRSQSNMDSCHAEMRRCIATMEQALDQHTLSSVAKLRRVMRLPSGTPRTVAFKIMNRLSQDVRGDTAYGEVLYRGSGWRRRTRPFAM